MSIRQDVYDRLATISPDCGDSSCRFAIIRGGMRTNGGCRCFESSRSLVQATPMEKLAASQRQIIEELLQEIERAK